MRYYNTGITVRQRLALKRNKKSFEKLEWQLFHNSWERRNWKITFNYNSQSPHFWYVKYKGSY